MIQIFDNSTGNIPATLDVFERNCFARATRGSLLSLRRIIYRADDGTDYDSWLLVTEYEGGAPEHIVLSPIRFTFTEVQP